MYSLAFVTV